ncbi:MAG: hypothetical protein Q9219_006584 [cf. Caloplaca sp. 3 TL-2023]
MAPLRLQIAVQPRPLPAPSGPVLSGPTVKWLEICHGDPTIQELSDILEARFFARNHSPLDIKILKFLDDLELYPSYKVRDIFTDISCAPGDLSFSTVKVYRNPPSSAELTCPQRFDSLPPDSLARPKKRTLPPTLANPERNGIRGPIEGLHPLRSTPKRRKVEESAIRPYADPDQPLDSLEPRHHQSSRIASQPLDPVSQVEDSQKGKGKSHIVPVTDEVSDPYGTPISSQTGLYFMDGLHVGDAITIPDSPSSRAGACGDKSPGHRVSRGVKRSRSPEIPTSNARSSQSWEALSEVPPPGLLPQSDQQHQTQAALDRNAAGSTPKVSDLPSPRLQKPVIDQPSRVTMGSGLRTPPPKNNDTNYQQSQPQRPKSKKRSRVSRRTRGVINGVKQKVPSIFDPIETSEGSSYEREQLRSAKRLKISAPAHETSASEGPQASSNGRSSRGPFLTTNAPKAQEEAPSVIINLTDKSVKTNSEKWKPDVQGTVSDVMTAPSTVENNAASIPNLADLESCQQPTTVEIDQSSPTTGSLDTSKVQLKDPQKEQPILSGNAAANSKPVEKLADGDSANVVHPSAQMTNDDSADYTMEHQLAEALENKRRAQAEFDRIAALQINRKQVDERRRLDILRKPEDADENLDTSKEKTCSAKPMSIEETRQYNLQHVTPGLNKRPREMLSRKGNEMIEEKEQQAMLKKQEKAALLEAQRQARLARAQETKEQRELAKQQAREKENQDRDRQENQTRETTRKAVQADLRSKQEQVNRVDLQQSDSKLRQRTQGGAATSAIIPASKRAIKNPYAQHKMLEQTEQNNQEVQEIRVASGSTRPRIQPQEAGQFRSKDTQLGKAVSATGFQESTVARVDTNDEPQQTVGEHIQSWLAERSPKAIHNAQRQLHFANEILKHSKRVSAADKGPYAAANSISTASKSDISAELPKARTLVAKAVKTASDKVATTDSQRGATNRGYTDSSALLAAGLFAANRPGTAIESIFDTSKATRTAPSNVGSNARKHIPEGPGAPGLYSSSPSFNQASSSITRTTTPAIPTPTLSKAKAVATARGASMGSGTLKTPIRSALRAAPGASGRSVSFAPGSLPSSQSQGANWQPKARTSGPKKGMLARAVEEHEAKQAEAANEKSKSSMSHQATIDNKPTKPTGRAKQTKLTQHIKREPKIQDKGKGKAIQSPSPIPREQIVISSASEASTFYSDESEEERNARAGPSTRRRLGPVSKARKVGDAPAAPNQATSGTAAKDHRHLTRNDSVVHVGSSQRGPRTGSATLSQPPKANAAVATAGKRAKSGLSQLTAYSDSESEGVSRPTDNVSLLPRISSPKEKTAAVDRQGYQDSDQSQPKAKSTQSRISSSLDPISPGDRIEDARMARLRKETIEGEEADRQLRREHIEAMRRPPTADVQSVRKESITKSLGKSAFVTEKGDSSQEKAGGKTAANATFDLSAISKLRKAQAAAKPTVTNAEPRVVETNQPARQAQAVQGESSDSDSGSSSVDSSDDVDSSQQMDQANSAGNPSQGSRLTRFAKEIFQGRK